jgi:hypothetical protein
VVNAQGYQAPARAPRDRGRLRRFVRVASLVSCSVIILFAVLAPNAVTTWRDACEWSVGAGIGAGLIALWLPRLRRPGRRSLLDWVAEMAVVSLLAGILRGGRRLG